MPLKAKLEFEIGNHTCYPKCGVPCRFYQAGDRCKLFRDERNRKIKLNLNHGGGWVMRCDQCLEAFPPEYK